MKPNMVSCIACTHALRRHDHSPATTYLIVVLILVRYFDDNCLVAHISLIYYACQCIANIIHALMKLLALSLPPSLVCIHLGSAHNCDSGQHIRII